MKIGVIGSRRRDSFRDLLLVREKFFELTLESQRTGETWIVSGGCPKGGDRFANWIAKKYGYPILIFYPDWDLHGKRAGFIRNTRIAECSDVLLACVAEDRTGGTEDTIRKFLTMKSPEDLYLI